MNISQHDAPFIAPFRYISNATIRNVKTTGRVHGGQHTGSQFVGSHTPVALTTSKAASTAASDVNGDKQTDILDITTLIDDILNNRPPMPTITTVVSNVDLDLGH